MNYSVVNYTLPLTETCLYDTCLQNYDRVQFLNICHDFKFDPIYDSHSPFMLMKSLMGFYVSNPKCRYYVEKGVLYTDDIEYFYESMDLDEDELKFWQSKNIKGRLLVAVPPAYPTEDFVVPEGVVGIFKGAFDGCHFNTIAFPKSLQLTPWCFLRYLRELKTIFVSSKVMCIEGLTGYSFLSTPNVEIKSSSPDTDIIESWKTCLGFYFVEDLEDWNVISPDDLYLADYGRELVYPNQRIERIVKKPESNLQLLTTLDNLCCIGEYEQLVRAMIFLQVEPALFYSSRDEEALKLIRAIWGNEENAKHFIQAHVPDRVKGDRGDERSFDVGMMCTSPNDIDDITKDVFDGGNCQSCAQDEEFYFNELELYIASILIDTKPRFTFDYIGKTFLKENVLIPQAVNILVQEFQKKNDLYVALNLLAIRDLHKWSTEYRELLHSIDFSEMEKLAFEAKDINSIYGRLRELTRGFSYTKDELIRQMTKDDFYECQKLYEMLMSDDILTIGSTPYSIKCMRRDATKMIKWIEKNVEVVDYVYTYEEPELNIIPIDITDCENPF